MSPAGGTAAPVAVPGASLRAPTLARPDRALWPDLAVIAVIAAVAAALRLPGLGAHLPRLADGDEEVLVGRTQQLLGGHLPAQYDWPSGPFVLLAPVYRLGGLVVPGLAVPDSGARYLAARGLVALAGIGLAVVTALLAAALLPPGPRRRVAAWTAGAGMAVAYTAVGSSRVAHPEVLQDLAATGALLVTLRLGGDPRVRWALLAGALGGAAAGLKYVGGVVVLVTVVAALTCGAGRRQRLRLAGTAAAAALAAFTALVPAVLVDPAGLVAGVDEQVLHSAKGHVGFDSAQPALLYHLARTLPESIGWPLGALAGAGLVAALWRGDGAARLVGLYCLLAAAPIGASHLVFPRYALLVLPALLALAGRLAASAIPPRSPRSRRWGEPVVLLVAGVLLAAPALDAARLARAAGAEDTRVEASAAVATLPAPVYEENFTVTSAAAGVRITGLDRRPDLGPGCRCYLVVSSFMEDRYRHESARYAATVARYDLLRRTAQVVRVIAPSVPLDYRWEALPEFGARNLPLTGALTVGPTVTIFRWD